MSAARSSRRGRPGPGLVSANAPQSKPQRLALICGDAEVPTERQPKPAEEQDSARPTLPSPLPPQFVASASRRRFYTIEEAAERLGVSATALRLRCQRSAKRVDGSLVAVLGGGLFAFKFGREWRLQLPEF